MEFVMSSYHMWATFVVILVAIVLYAHERLAVEVVSLGVMATLILLFYFFPLAGPTPLGSADFLAGFAHPAVITILSLMVIGQGLTQTAALEGPTTLLLRYGRRRPTLLIFVCLLIVMALSAFLNDTPVVVLFLPIMLVLAEKLKEMPGRFLMPLSFAAILGGMTTLLGTSTNLLVAGSFQSLTGESIGFFDFTVPGAILALTGFCYLWIAGPFLLKTRPGKPEDNHKHHGHQFVVQFTIGRSSSLAGKAAIAGMLPDLAGLTVRVIEKPNQVFLPPFEDMTLESGDTIVGAITRNRFHALLEREKGLILEYAPAFELQTANGEKQVPHLYEAFIPPASILEGRTLRETGFDLNHSGTIIGIQRRSRMPRVSLYDIRLQAGDILLVCGSKKQMRGLRTNRNVVLMEWSGHAIQDKSKKWIARSIFLATIAGSASGLAPIVLAAFVGAFLMIILGCLTVQQASRAVNRQVYLLVTAALAMGTAMHASGGASFLAHLLIDLLQGSSPPLLLSALFILIALISNILSNNTTAILFTPIAIDMANELELAPLPFVVTVIFAANCSFATPVSYQTNLLVMGPGRYVFADYLRFGVPLVIVLWATFSIVVPWYYGI